jgi:hypothetical protein
MCLRYDDSDVEVRSDYPVSSLRQIPSTDIRQTHSLSREPVVLEVAGSEGLHQTGSRGRLQHLCTDLYHCQLRYTCALGPPTPASSGTNVIIIHSYFPPSLLSSRYAKLAGDFGVGNVG